MIKPHFSTRILFFLLALLFWWSYFFVNSAKAYSQVPLEYQVKAVYIYKLLKFIEWPGRDISLEESFPTIGVLGDTPLIEGLSELKAKNPNFKPKIIQLDSLNELPVLHVLFVSGSENLDQKKIISSINGQPVVTFGENESFLQNGGMINFLLEAGKVRFDINLKELKTSGIRLSSRALKAANRIIK